MIERFPALTINRAVLPNSRLYVRTDFNLNTRDSHSVNPFCHVTCVTNYYSPDMSMGPNHFDPNFRAPVILQCESPKLRCLQVGVVVLEAWTYVYVRPGWSKDGKKSVRFRTSTISRRVSTNFALASLHMKQPPPRAELSEGLRGEIISMRKHDHTFSAIAAELSVH